MKKIFTAVAVVALTGALATAQENYSTEWSQHTNVVMNTTASGAGVFTPVLNFPVLVRLGAANAAVFTQANSDGSDLRFTKADNTTRLHHEIEEWDATGQSAAIWVRVDTVYGNRNNQHIRMHWGNAGAADSSNGEAVFDTASGFRAVWHMDGSADETDVTANALVAEQSGTVASAAGVIGSARSFGGSPNYLNVLGSDTALHFPAFANFTISAWVNPNAINGDAAIISKSDNAYALKFFRETAYEFFDFQDSWISSHSMTAPTVGTWVHLFGVNDEVQPRLYVNGVLETDFPDVLGDGARTDGLNVNIGREPQGTGGRRYFNGLIDEVRFHQVSRNASWARLEYQNQRPTGQTLVQLLETIPALDTTAAPGAPTGVTATLGTFAGQANITWTAPSSTGGAAITAYAVAASPGTGTCATTGATTCTITGLVAGTSYTFSVRASNMVGQGPESEPSDSLLIPVGLRSALVIHLAGNRNPFVFRMPSGIGEAAESLTLSVVDMWGRTVWTRTVNPSRDKVSEIAWDGKTSTGRQAAAGMYVVRATVTEQGRTTRHDLKGITLAPR